MADVNRLGPEQSEGICIGLALATASGAIGGELRFLRSNASAEQDWHQSESRPTDFAFIASRMRTAHRSSEASDRAAWPGTLSNRRLTVPDRCLSLPRHLICHQYCDPQFLVLHTVIR
jgi:hypothetical protein